MKFTTFLIKIGYKDASSAYDDANKELLEEYLKNYEIDGELNFFAVDSKINGKGRKYR